MVTFLHGYQHLALVPDTAVGVDWEAYPVKQLCCPGFCNISEWENIRLVFVSTITVAPSHTSSVRLPYRFRVAIAPSGILVFSAVPLVGHSHIAVVERFPCAGVPKQEGGRLAIFPFPRLLTVFQFPDFQNLVLKHSENHASDKSVQHLMCHSALLTLTYKGKDGVQGGKSPLLYISTTL